MIKKHIKWAKIGEFRSLVTTLNREFTYAGDDENGDPIYDPSIEKPTLTAFGTVKGHGTNASCCYNDEHGVWSQSRTRIITPQADNHGFAFFAESKKEIFKEFFEKIKEKHNIDTSDLTLSIFGEWLGQRVQSGVAVSNLEKSLFIFAVKVSRTGDPDFKSYLLPSDDLRDPDNRIYNMADYTTYEVDIDFKMPALSQNKFVDIVAAIEAECPIGKAFGFSGIGEGAVFKVEYDGVAYFFKAKGKKHSSSNVKTVAAVDTEKLNSIVEFVDYSVTRSRYDQAIKEVFGEGELDVKKVGDFIRWMVNDITEEEVDTMADNGLEPKQVNKYISSRAREMFFKDFNSF